MKSLIIALAATSTLFLSACVETQSNGPTYNIAIPFGLDFTPDEVNIWNGLNDTQRLRAIEFIKNGGTLIASLSPD